MGRIHQIMSLFVYRTTRNEGTSGEARTMPLAARNDDTLQQQQQRTSNRRIQQQRRVVIALLGAIMIVLNMEHISLGAKQLTRSMPMVSNRHLSKVVVDRSQEDYHARLLEDHREILQQQVVTILDQIGMDSLCETEYGDRIVGCLSSSSVGTNARLLTGAEECGGEDIPWGLSSYEWTTINIVGSVFCVFAVALMSSMFLGFMTLDPLDLRIKIRASLDSEERENAARLLPLVEDHHRLLVTLLLVDAVFYETMPIFLDNLFPSWAAILLSVTVLLVVGEIIPSAIFTGPEQLRLASRMTPLMSFFLKVLYPLAAPLIWLLNSMVPPEDPEEEAYNRGELSALVRIQYEEREEARRAVNFTGLVPSTGKVSNMQPHPKRVSTVGPVKTRGNVFTVTDKSRGWRNLKREIMEAVEQRHHDSHNHNHMSTASSTSSPLHQTFHDRSQRRHRSHSIGSDHESIHSLSTGPAYEQIAPPLHQAEVKMVEGALTMKTKCAWDVYTPLRKIFAVPYDMELDRNSIADIYGEGYSRVPVFERMPPPNEHRQYAMRGILMTRQLIMIDWLDKRPVSSLPLYYPPCISPRMNLIDVLQLLQKGGSHIAFVCAGPDMANKALEEDRAIPIESGFMGLITLEDVLEAILQDHIYDEEDVSDRDLASALLTQWAAKILQRFYRKRVLVKQQQLATSVSGDGEAFLSVSPTDADKDVPASFRSSTRDPASVMALATSTKLATTQSRPTTKSDSIPEEIDLEMAHSSVAASEKTPLLGRLSAHSSLSESRRHDSS
ncbi:protein of unknown function DUF21-domain containing protein [Nitzschia inconspicua]|uniref:CNNM transmembrane domain-containing protein n=1 Tax=Nitzschia inconspicua TaxID=303405 RepID=A0A9K3PBF7_9STRA|nr:protein of unknown function DUF21-domain containing protein [Nitzschia inconspicua]